MQGLVLRWLVSAAAVAIVAWLLPGIHVGQGPGAAITALVGAGILGLVNLLVKPLLVLLSCPLVLLSLGLFLFVINAAMLLMASSMSQALGFGFYVDGWANALLGSILITIVTWVLSAIMRGDEKKEKRA